MCFKCVWNVNCLYCWGLSMGNFCHSWDRQKHFSFLSIYHTESSNSAGRSFISASDCCSCVVLHTALPQQCWFCSSALMNFRHSGFEVVVVCLVATQVTLSKPFSAARASGLRGLDAICTFAFHVVFRCPAFLKKIYLDTFWKCQKMDVGWQTVQGLGVPAVFW